MTLARLLNSGYGRFGLLEHEEGVWLRGLKKLGAFAVEN